MGSQLRGCQAGRARQAGQPVNGAADGGGSERRRETGRHGQLLLLHTISLEFQRIWACLERSPEKGRGGRRGLGLTEPPRMLHCVLSPCDHAAGSGQLDADGKRASLAGFLSSRPALAARRPPRRQSADLWPRSEVAMKPVPSPTSEELDSQELNALGAPRALCCGAAAGGGVVASARNITSAPGRLMELRGCRRPLPPLHHLPSHPCRLLSHLQRTMPPTSLRPPTRSS